MVNVRVYIPNSSEGAKVPPRPPSPYERPTLFTLRSLFARCERALWRRLLATQVAGTPRLHKVDLKKILVQTLNDVGHPTRCPQPLNSVRLMVPEFLKPTLCKGGVPATCAQKTARQRLCCDLSTCVFALKMDDQPLAASLEGYG